MWRFISASAHQFKQLCLIFFISLSFLSCIFIRPAISARSVSIRSLFVFSFFTISFFLKWVISLFLSLRNLVHACKSHSTCSTDHADLFAQRKRASSHTTMNTYLIRLLCYYWTKVSTAWSTNCTMQKKNFFSLFISFIQSTTSVFPLLDAPYRLHTDFELWMQYQIIHNFFLDCTGFAFVNSLNDAMQCDWCKFAITILAQYLVNSPSLSLSLVHFFFLFMRSAAFSSSWRNFFTFFVCFVVFFFLLFVAPRDSLVWQLWTTTAHTFCKWSALQLDYINKDFSLIAARHSYLWLVLTVAVLMRLKMSFDFLQFMFYC